jgi:hypothetical protein
VLVRPGTSDVAIFWDTFARSYHLPPAGAWCPANDFGPWREYRSDGGVFRCRYPDARVLGVELDADNVALARRNTAVLGNRCEVMAERRSRQLPWPTRRSLRLQVTGITAGTKVELTAATPTPTPRECCFLRGGVRRGGHPARFGSQRCLSRTRLREIARSRCFARRPRYLRGRRHRR